MAINTDIRHALMSMIILNHRPATMKTKTRPRLGPEKISLFFPQLRIWMDFH